MDEKDILFRKLTGTISTEEEQRLDQWLNGADSNRRLYNATMEMGNIAEDYKVYRNLNPDKRWRQLCAASLKKERARRGIASRLKHIYRLLASTAATLLCSTRRYTATALALTGMAMAAMAQTTVSGTITDEQGEPLIGVTVSAEAQDRQSASHNLKTVSDIDGHYAITLPGGSAASIAFSYIGFQALTLHYDGSNAKLFEHVRLKPDAVKIDNVVITGIYKRNKDSFTGSSASYKGEELKRVGAQSILQSLQTLDPSFRIMDNVLAGSNPNQMPDVEIRGKSSVAGLKEEFGSDPNQPLFILDGFETTLETVMNLNMNRVASVTLLKDAASTAIYGSKASNGVVVIETKTPTKGRLQISYKGDYGLEIADLSDYNLMDSREKLEFERLAGVYTDRSNDPFSQIRLDNLYNARLRGIEQGVDTYWLSEPIRTGLTHKHNVYAEGGEERIRYGIGMTYGMVDGVMKGSNRENISGNIDLVYRTGDLQFSNKLTIDYQSTNDPVVSFQEYALANPYYKKRNQHGGVDKYLYLPDNGVDDNPVANPLYNASLNNYDRGESFGFTDKFIIEWFAASDLRLRGKFSISKTDDTQDTRLSPLHSQFDDLAETKRGLFTHSLTKSLYYEGDMSATYGRMFANRHQVNAVAGFNISSSKYTAYGYSANGFTDDQFGAPSFANGYPDNEKSLYNKSEKRAASFYLNGGYAYDNRYLIDVNLRRDGASMFGTDNRFRTTWSVGIGWNVHNESWMGAGSLFQMLKLRASVGNPGNQNFAAYQAYSTYTFNGWMTNVFGAGVILNALGNKELAWQETINWNIGADITTWSNRLNVTIDYFIKDTDPLLAIITTPGSMGVTSEALNAGKQKTRGWEATLKVSPVYMPAERINWNLSFNAAHTKSEYANIGNAFSALNESGKKSLAGTTRYYDGGSPTAIWAVRSAGIDPATGKELFIKKDGTYSFTYNVSDEVVCGDTEPDWEGIVGTTLYYKGFSVGAYFRYELGGQVFNSSLFEKVENISSEDIYNNQDKRALYNRWSSTNRIAQFKGISMVQKTDKSSRFVMDENTLSLESVSIGYEFPAAVCNRLGIEALSLQANMNDLFRWSTVKVERGIDYPFARNISFSIGATF